MDDDDDEDDDDEEAEYDVVEFLGSSKPTATGMSFDYPADSIVRDRLPMEKENARHAGAAAAKIMKDGDTKKPPPKKKTKTSHKTAQADMHQSKLTMDDLMTEKVFRKYLKHEDLVEVCDEIENKVTEKSKEYNRLASLTQTLAASMTSGGGKALKEKTNTPPTSPNTKKTHKMDHISKLEDQVIRLKAEREQMERRKEPQAEIDEMTSRIKQYTVQRSNLEKEYFSQG